ncbi:hypothetical protein [Bacillus sp. FDAARGOS_1420]|uniref:hypothetical protein n=1 Tax=unclassified Bacillus (in: firmicutes) TaxID=185979 RepID=UPI001C5B9D42|nr:hypothetical protein [Bacillus sp. FDAARGOS_1420]MBW3496191.1 hypothetical protein [Bacillus sp. FDAARGOS_1420]
MNNKLDRFEMDYWIYMLGVGWKSEIECTLNNRKSPYKTNISIREKLSFLVEAFPELKENRDFYDWILSD